MSPSTSKRWPAHSIIWRSSRGPVAGPRKRRSRIGRSSPCRKVGEYVSQRAAYHYELASSHNYLGNLHQTTGRAPAAEQAYHQALAVGEKVVAAAPEVSDCQSKYCATCHHLAVLIEARGDLAEVRATRGLQEAAAGD